MTLFRRIPANLREQLRLCGIKPSDLVLYINSACNLRCKHCYVGDALLNAGVTYSSADIIDLVNQFEHLDRLTIVGGEPLLHPGINDLIAGLPYHKIGLIRLTTNLTTLAKFDCEALAKSNITICVSLDGHNAEIHDHIRGSGAFEATRRNLDRLLELDFDIEVTHTISSINLPYFYDFVSMCKHVGIRQLNLHRISLQGNAMSNSALAVSASQWVEFRDILELSFAGARLGEPEGRIHVRYPVLFVTSVQFEKMLRGGEYHHHINGSFYGNGDRLVLYPDGRLYISSEAFGTEHFVGDISTGQLQWNDTATSELALFRSDRADIAVMNALQSGDQHYPVVLSVSFKRSGFL